MAAQFPPPGYPGAPTPPALAPAGAPAGPGAPAAPPAKPKGMIRWGGVLLFLLIPAVALFVLRNMLARNLIESGWHTAMNSNLTLGDVSVDLLAGKIRLTALKATDLKKPDKVLFEAESADLDVDVHSLLRGHAVLDEVRIVRPKGKIVRRPDGSIGIVEEEPVPPEGEDPEAWRKRWEKAKELAKGRDFVEDMKTIAKKVEDWKKSRDEQQKQKEEEARRAEQAGGGHPSGHAQYIRKEQPTLIVHLLVCEDMNVEVKDTTGEAPPLQLQRSRLEVRNLSSSPGTYEHPIEVDLESGLAGAGAEATKLAMKGSLALFKPDLASSLKLLGEKVPLHLLDPYVRETLPIQLKPGMLGDIDLPLTTDGLKIDWLPALKLDNIQTALRDPNQKTIAGMDAQKLVQALNDVKALVVSDLRVHGLLTSPDVDMGSTLTTLAREGAKAFAKKQADAAAAAAQSKLQQEADKALGKLGAKAGDNPAAKGLLDGASGLIKGAGDAAGGGAKEGASGLVDSIFGGSKKDE